MVGFGMGPNWRGFQQNSLYLKECNIFYLYLEQSLDFSL